MLEFEGACWAMESDFVRRLTGTGVGRNFLVEWRMMIEWVSVSWSVDVVIIVEIG